MSNCVSWQRKNKCYMICNPHPFVCCARLDCYTVLALWLWDCQWSRTVNRDMNLTTDWHHFLWSSKRHCHSPQTTYSSKSTCCVLSAQESAMRVVVYADRLTTLHSIVDIIDWSWRYWQIWYPIGHVECFWAALLLHTKFRLFHIPLFCHNIHGGK